MFHFSIQLYSDGFWYDVLVPMASRLARGYVGSRGTNGSNVFVRSEVGLKEKAKRCRAKVYVRIVCRVAKTMDASIFQKSS